jgi:hypothetical protein
MRKHAQVDTAAEVMYSLEQVDTATCFGLGVIRCRCWQDSLHFNLTAICRLRAKPVRTASGIAVVAVMSKPHRCPHIATTGAVCVYCPGGPDSDFEYSTQSYTGVGATPSRGIALNWHRPVPSFQSVGVLLLMALLHPCRLRADEHAGNPGAVQPICAGPWTGGPAAQAGPQRGQGPHPLTTNEIGGVPGVCPSISV